MTMGNLAGGRFMRIQWSDRFATGNLLVDHQHQALFASVNEFADALDAGASDTQVDHLLGFLERYVQEHFATEELLMVRSEFPALALHRSEHERLASRVRFIRDLRSQDPSQVPPEGVGNFLSEWLQNHILTWDQAFFRHLREHPLED